MKKISKRGQLTYKFGMEILVAAIVVITFIGVAYTYGNGEAVKKIRAAKDIGLMIEEMYLIPDDINTFITYPEDLSNFDIIIEEDIVKVSSTGSDVTEAHYNFVNSKNHLPINTIIKKPGKIYVGKINGKILISDKKPKLIKLNCPEARKKTQINNILIDSGIDENGDLEKAKLANTIAFSLISKLNRNYQVEHTRNKNINDLTDNPLTLIESNLKEKIEKADVIIGIQIAEKKDNSNNIKIYFSQDSIKKEETVALACTILNSIVEDEDLNEITGISIIPKEELILNNEKISMIIEIGNYLNEDSLDMLKDINKIGSIISIIYDTIK